MGCKGAVRAGFGALEAVEFLVDVKVDLQTRGCLRHEDTKRSEMSPSLESRSQRVGKLLRPRIWSLSRQTRTCSPSEQQH